MEPLSQPLPNNSEHATISELSCNKELQQSSLLVTSATAICFAKARGKLFLYVIKTETGHLIKTETGHLCNVVTKIQTAVKKDTQIPCGICWIHLIVQHRKEGKVNKLPPLRFRANENKLSLARIEF